METEVSEEFLPVVKCVAFTGRLADVWCDPETERAVGDAVTGAQDLLGMNLTDLEETMDKITQGFLEMSGIFQIDLGNPQEIQETLDKAKEIMRNTATSDSPQPASV